MAEPVQIGKALGDWLRGQYDAMEADLDQGNFKTIAEREEVERVMAQIAKAIKELNI